MFTMPEGTVHSTQVKTAAVSALGPNGAWLLLTIDHFGWRARYDLASALVEGRPDLDSHIGRHVQSMIDLEIQSAIYTATEQLLRLVLACLAHEHGTNAFFTTYVRRTTVVPLIDEAQQVTREQLGQLAAVPQNAEEMAAIMESHGIDADADLVNAAVQRVDDLFDEIHQNLTEFSQLTVAQEIVAEIEPLPQGHPLRYVDNSYRHGLKVFLPDTLPAERDFAALGPNDLDIIQGAYFIDLYLSEEEPVFGGVDARPERTEQNLQALASVCLRIKQLARAFLGTRIMDEPGTVLTLHHFDLDELPVDLV